jgi:hypothetical protein
MKILNSIVIKIILLSSIILTGCGGENYDSNPIRIVFDYERSGSTHYDRPIGTVLAVHGKSNLLLEAGFQNTWNTYCQNDFGDIHIYQTEKMIGNIEVIGKPSEDFKSGYVWKWDNILYAEDKGNTSVDTFDLNGNYIRKDNPLNIIKSRADVDCGVYVYNKYRYHYMQSKTEDVNSIIYACDYKNNCAAAILSPKEWVYTYAAEARNVLAASNNGRVFFHDQINNKWCEASYINQEYICLPANMDVVRRPGIQFYSSIQYGENTLLGMFPGGNIYQFKEGKLTHWSNDRLKDYSDNYAEAQSMSIFCGSLYVGYWPWGEVYTYHDNNWFLANRFFSDPHVSSIENNVNYPFFYRTSDEQSQAFYGQRVSSLIPFENSLIAATSNLNSWNSSIGDGVISKNLAYEYGLIHKFNQKGCLTSKVIGRDQSKTLFSIEIRDNELKIISNYGEWVTSTTLKKSEITNIEMPSSGKFGAYLGQNLKLISISGL